MHLARPVVLALALLSCTAGDRVGPSRLPALQADVSVATDLPAVRISEIHYDNTGTDAGEAIEVWGPAGMDVTGWRIYLYNGNGGATYEPTRTLAGAFPATCGARGVLVQNYPVNGIQNGDPDGIALVDASGAVVEFLSYEGTFAGVGGPANGLTSIDIGVSETSTTPVGHSLARSGSGVWTGPSANTFGACNDDEPPPPPPPPALPPTRFSELHYDNVGTDAGEAIEIEGPAGTDLAGWSVVLYNGNGGAPYNTRALSGTIPDQCGGRGVQLLAYPQDGIQNGSPDGLALVNAAGAVVEFLSYEGTFAAVGGPADGLVSSDIGVAQSGAPFGQSLQRDAAGAWSGSSGQSRGGCNSAGPLPPPSTISFSGRLATDQPLPVGFEDQLFATLRDGSGTVVPAATFTWASESPALARIDQDGVMHALGAGMVTFRATALDGTTATFSLPMAVATASTTAQYGNHTEFGSPTDAGASDDFPVERAEYTASWNGTRGTPNWVSYNLDATHIVAGLDRCDCFTFDPLLPQVFAPYTTADYTGAGAFAGYGIDRGHLARSFDRTSGSLDNARTFYFTNIIPQAADLNQGPWAVMETVLGDLARFQDREVYIVAGVAGSKGTVKNEGKITIPASAWKVAVILPRDQGLANVRTYQDVEVIAVIMPNDSGVRGVDWATYRTTVNAVEALSGYDLLARLPDDIEMALETGIHTVQALVDGLAAEGMLKSGAATSLTAKLRAAAQQLERGNVTAGVNQLGGFLNELAALVRSGRLNAVDAAPLEAAATALIDAASNEPAQVRER